jgi:hypothetical protein
MLAGIPATISAESAGRLLGFELNKIPEVVSQDKPESLEKDLQPLLEAR